MSKEPTGTEQARQGDVRFSFENGLVDVDASLRLPVVARLCRERGYLFPLARPLPAFSLAKACASVPFLIDAYVSSVDAVTDDGLALSTGRAPRAATGPDLLGALCCDPPLAIATRVRLRVLDARAARISDERYEDGAQCVERFLCWLDEGRAFSVHAFRDDDKGFRVCALGGPAAVSQGEPAGVRDFGRGRPPSIVSSRSLVPGDRRAMLAALGDGARVVAAPFMGRAAALFAADVATPSRGRGASALADALARAARGTHA